MKKKKFCMRGFTVTELLVVVGIITLVVGVAIPTYLNVQKSARATKSMTNLRQWGVGYVSFAHDNSGKFPWEGLKNPNQMPQNMNYEIWWGNAIPPYVGQEPYGSLASIPLPGEANNIFIDPSAQSPEPTGGDDTFRGWIGGGKRFYFNYVPNAEFNNHMDIASIPEIERRVRLSQIRQPANTILMMEMRSVPQELLLTGSGTSNPFWNENLARHMGDWQRFAARHSGGGHMLFCDGSTRWVNHVDACTPQNGSYGHHTSSDYNKPWLIWDPLGPTNESP
jgi:prepilin-type processing-associated H-X9-DG protein